MRFINGLTGCIRGRGVEELESATETSIRVVDGKQGKICVLIGGHAESAILTVGEALQLAKMLEEAAARVEEDEPR